MKIDRFPLPCLFFWRVVLSAFAAGAATPEEQADAFFGRGLAAEQRGDYIAVAHCYALALRVNPEHAQALARLEDLETRNVFGTEEPAKTVIIDHIQVHSSPLQGLPYRDARLRELFETLTRQSGIPIVYEGLGYPSPQVSFDLKNVTVDDVLNKVVQQTGFTLTYERDVARLSPPITELTDAAAKARVNKAAQFEGVVSRVDGGGKDSTWVRFVGTEFYLFCRPQNIGNTFDGADPREAIMPGQRLKARGMVGLFQNTPWMEMHTSSQWEVVKTEDRERAPNQPATDASTQGSLASNNAVISMLKHGKEPASSADTSVPPFIWNGKKSSLQYVQQDLPEVQAVEGCQVYWFQNGEAIKTPAFWKVLYLDDAGFWMPVDATPAKPSADGWNELRFSPLRTRALRLLVQLDWDCTAGFLEWRILTSTADPSPVVKPSELWLDDLLPVESTAEWAVCLVNQYANVQGKATSQVLLDGQPCERFLFAHANSRMSYAVPPGYSRISAIGISPTRPDVKEYAWSYQVLADEKEVFKSEPLGTYPNKQVAIDVDLPPGTQTLTLVTTNNGDMRNDHSIWAHPRLIAAPTTLPCSPETKARLAQLAEEFEAARAKAVDVPHAEGMSVLKARYRTALEAALAKARQGAGAEVVTALEQELTLAAVPPNDAEGTPAEVAQLRKIYREQSAAAEESRNKNLQPLLDRYDAELAALEVGVAANPLDAAAVQAARKAVADQRPAQTAP